MQVDVISFPKDLSALQANWDAIYERDPEAHYFVSYTFLSSYLRRFGGAYTILAARTGAPGSPYVALFPLRMRLRMNRQSAMFHNELNMAGSYAADYTGMVSEPECAEQALAAFARRLKTMNWRMLHLENLRMSERRIKALIENLADARIELRPQSRVNAVDNVDNSICPLLMLPESFDAYLDNQVGSSTRQKLRRYLRKVDAGAFVIRDATPASMANDIDQVLELWRTKWAPRKRERIPGLMRSHRAVITEAFRSGTLYFPSMWDGDRMIGGLIILLDHIKHSMLFLMAGRDETFSEIPCGLVLHGHAIRHAIKNGFTSYDFLRGNEPYKYAFGAKDVRITSVLAQVRSGRNLGDRLDSRSVMGAFEEASKLHQAGDLANAEKVYLQVLDTDPLHAHSLYGFGQLLAARGEHGEAASVFESLVHIVPRMAKAWLRFAIELQILGRHREAIIAFNHLLELKPGLTRAAALRERSAAALGRQAPAPFAHTPAGEQRLLTTT